MSITFINRKSELKNLREVLKADNSFSVIYGRRRAGKTALIKQIIKNESNVIYLLCEEGYRINLQILSTIIYKKTGLDIEFKDYKNLFKVIKGTNKKWIIVFDEFQNIIDKKAILSEFQYIIDEIIRNSKIHFIILGSSITLMRSFLEYTSPLYGRRDLSIYLKPLKFADSVNFNNKSIEENVKIFGVCGGIPLYHKLVKSVDDIKQKALAKDSFLYNEINFLLSSEFNEFRVYNLIMSAIAKGKTTFNDISNHTGIQKTNLFIYLETLINLGFVERETPVTSSLKTKKSIYRLKDRYLEFYYYFIEPYKSLIEMEDYSFFPSFEKEYNAHIGRVFEDIVKELMFSLKPIDFTKIGRWWHKDKEIDIVGINENTKELLAVEVKWKDLGLKDVKEIIEELKEKVKYVEWFNNERKEKLGIFAKKMNKKAKEWLKENGYMGWDLQILEKEIGKLRFKQQN